MLIARRALLHLTFLFAMIGSAYAATPTPQSPATPTAERAPRPAASRPAASVVWVNTSSGYYHQPASRHYGKTKHGKYMTESDAIRAGYRPARN